MMSHKGRKPFCAVFIYLNPSQLPGMSKALRFRWITMFRKHIRLALSREYSVPRVAHLSVPPLTASSCRLLVAQDIRILAAVDRRLEKMEEHFAKSLDDLTKTLDKFLKRLTDIEEEFIFMKEDLKRVKAVIREKLGVSLD